MLHFVEKLLTKTRRTVFIEDCRCPEFGICGTVKFDLHRRFS